MREIQRKKSTQSMGIRKSRHRGALRREVCGSADEESKICGVSNDGWGEISISRAEMHQVDQAGRSLDRNGRCADRISRMMGISPRRGKTVLFVFLIIPRGIREGAILRKVVDE